jgi:hypothetical protein
MTIEFLLGSKNGALLLHVGEFASGLGWEPDGSTASALRVRVPDDAGLDVFLHFLNQIALTATSMGIDLAEPTCRVQYRERHASVEVALEFRLADISLRGPSMGA